jgi:para-nitrobenzyl esterase
MASPLTKGLFHRAIVQSGAIQSGAGGVPRVELPLKDAEQLGKKLATRLGVSILAELRAKSWQEIITAALAPGSGYRTVMTVDGWSLLDELNHVFQAGRQTDVPFMIGATEADILPLFTGTQDLVATMKFKSKTYVFIFAHVPSGWESKGVKAGHGFDVAYLFYHLELLPIFLGRSVPSSAGPDPGFDEKDEYVAEAVMALWAQFAKTGNPSIEGLITWPPYEYVTDQYLKIDYPLEVLSGFSKLKQ